MQDPINGFPVAKKMLLRRGLGECDSQMSKQPTGRRPENGGALPPSTASSAAEAVQILFGENFRLARIKAGLTQRDVEAETHIKQAYVSQLEGGKMNPTLATMVVLAQVVGKDVRALLKPPTPPKPK